MTHEITIQADQWIDLQFAERPAIELMDNYSIGDSIDIMVTENELAWHMATAKIIDVETVGDTTKQNVAILEEL